MADAALSPDSAAHAFVFFPNRDVHASWRQALLSAPLWELLETSGRTEGRLAAYVAAKAGLPPPSPLQFPSPRERFCLLPSTALTNVTRRVGLVLNAARFGKVIDGRLVARIKRELGADAYEFALRRASLITAQTDPLTASVAAGTPLTEQLERSGVNYIGLALRGVVADILGRFKLKLPMAYGSLVDAPTGDVAPDAAWTVVRKVVRETEPTWSASLE